MVRYRVLEYRERSHKGWRYWEQLSTAECIDHGYYISEILLNLCVEEGWELVSAADLHGTPTIVLKKEG